MPFSIDWLPDGTLLAVAGQEAQLLRFEGDGSFSLYADLSKLGTVFNEIVIDSFGNAYVNGDSIVLVRPDGSAVEVANGLEFGNGMAIYPDGKTLIVAESHGNRLSAFTIAGDGTLHERRIWADLGEGVPDGICIDAEGAVWYADVPNKECVRVREGGQVLERVSVDRGCFACILGGPDGRTLFILAAHWYGMDQIFIRNHEGQLLTHRVEVPHAGLP